MNLPKEYEAASLPNDFGNQYSYFCEDLDPRFPESLLQELDINIFVDANHGHDKITRRSITGLFDIVGSTLMMWSSKRQPSVQTLTFGSEFTALKNGVENAITLRYHLRSMGVPVTKHSVIYSDNMGLIINAKKPASTLN